MRKLILVLACVLASAGCRGSDEHDYTKVCKYYAENLAEARAGVVGAVQEHTFYVLEKYCDTTAADKDALLLAAAKKRVERVRKCFQGVRFAPPSDGSTQLTMPSCIKLPGSAGCSDYVSTSHYKIWQAELMEAKCLNSSLTESYGLSLFETMAAMTAGSESSVTSEQDAYRVLYSDFAEFRKGLCLSAADALISLPSEETSEAGIEDLKNTLLGCEMTESANTLVPRAYARIAERLLAELRARKYEFPESREKVQSLEKILSKATLKPEQIGTTVEELKKLSLEDPLVE